MAVVAMGLARNSLANAQFGAYGEPVAFGLVAHPFLKLGLWLPVPCPTTSWAATTCPTSTWAAEAGVTSTWGELAGAGSLGPPKDLGMPKDLGAPKTLSSTQWSQESGPVTSWVVNPDSDPEC